jgi:NAD-dependent DNA ligase
MTEKIYINLDKALKNTQLHILMSASNLFGRGLGIKKLHVITKKYPNIMNENWDKKEMYDRIIKLDGFQDKTVQKFIDGFDKFVKFFNRLNKYIDLTYIKEPKYTKKENSELFKGKKIVLTGFRSAEITEFIEKNGGEITNNISSKTFLLICSDDTDKTTSKYIKAEELGIKIMTKSKFTKKYIEKK